MNYEPMAHDELKTLHDLTRRIPGDWSTKVTMVKAVVYALLAIASAIREHRPQ
jgi:hypothetical protein